MLDVPRELIWFASGLLAARRQIGTREGTRRLGCYKQALFALAWFRDRGNVPQLGSGLGLPQSTAYRYLDEGIEVLLQSTAGQAALVGHHALVDALLAAALPLIGPDQTDVLIAVRTARHAALYSLGRLEEADEEYRALQELSLAALGRADATTVQIRSLTHRNRHADTLGLGLGALRELGIAVPAADRLAADLDRQFGYLFRWLGADIAGDLARPQVTDPALLAWAG